MTEGVADASANALDILTERQREVLDLLLEHKTSKEIARALDISPHTVDQRIRFAKEKLGVERRSDLASVYRQHRRICEKTVYDESHIEKSAIPLQEGPGPSERTDLIVNAVHSKASAAATVGHDNIRLVPAIFEGPSAILMRVGAVFAIAAAVIIVGVGGLAMVEQLSRLMS